MRRLLTSGLSILGLLLVSTPIWADATLREALDSAWKRSVQARVAESRSGEAQARGVVAKNWFAEAPTIGLSAKNDRFNNNRGEREREIELALPLWLPGQRAAHEAFARSDTADAQAALAAARLALAGELRATLWNLAAANAESEIASERLMTAEKLQAEVLRRQKAGELARTDLLLAQEEALAAKASAFEAQTRALRALGRWRVLTGLDSMPIAIHETVATSTAEAHTLWVLAQTAVDRARAELQLIGADRGNPPELSIGVVQTRDVFAASSARSVRIGIRVPLGTEARNAPKLAAANTQWIKAEAELRQTVAEIEAWQREAQSTLDSAVVTDQAAQSRAALAGERLALQQKAFALGELGLTEFMRMRAAAVESRLEMLRASYALSAARAGLNQARGILP